MSGLQRPVVLNVAEEPGYKHNRSQVHELKHEDGRGQNDDVPGVQKLEVHLWIGLDHASHDGRPKQKNSRDNHRNDRTGVQPVQPLSLIQCTVQKSKTDTEVSEPEPARPRIWINLSRDSEMD